MVIAQKCQLLICFVDIHIFYLGNGEVGGGVYGELGSFPRELNLHGGRREIAAVVKMSSKWSEYFIKVITHDHQDFLA